MHVHFASFRRRPVAAAGPAMPRAQAPDGEVEPAYGPVASEWTPAGEVDGVPVDSQSVTRESSSVFAVESEANDDDLPGQSWCLEDSDGEDVLLHNADLLEVRE